MAAKKIEDFHISPFRFDNTEKLAKSSKSANPKGRYEWGESFYYWIECIYTEGNTFKISFWDCLAGIAMVLNSVKKTDLEGG